jgi:hypothetical protein
MALMPGIDPSLTAPQTVVLPLHYISMDSTTGFEPAFASSYLTLDSYSRWIRGDMVPSVGFEPTTARV